MGEASHFVWPDAGLPQVLHCLVARDPNRGSAHLSRVTPGVNAHRDDGPNAQITRDTPKGIHARSNGMLFISFA